MAPMIVLLPGLHGTGGLWGALLAEIPAGVRTRVIEHTTKRVCGYGALRRRVEEELRREGEMVLVAESFSGAMALEIAARDPPRVKGVVLCASFVTRPVPAVLSVLGAGLALVGAGVYVPGWAVKVFLAGSGGSRELVRGVQREVRRVWPAVLAYRVLQAAWIDGRRALARCKSPVLLLAGRKDRLVGPRSVRRMKRVRGDMAVKVIEGPHLLAQVRAREVWGEIEGFLGELGCRNYLKANMQAEGPKGGG